MPECSTRFTKKASTTISQLSVLTSVHGDIAVHVAALDVLLLESNLCPDEGIEILFRRGASAQHLRYRRR